MRHRDVLDDWDEFFFCVACVELHCRTPERFSQGTMMLCVQEGEERERERERERDSIRKRREEEDRNKTKQTCLAK